MPEMPTPGSTATRRNSPAPPWVVATASRQPVRARISGMRKRSPVQRAGGNDTIRATGTGDGVLTVYGDGTLSDRALGGNDTIHAKGPVTVYGEGESLGSSRGGGDDVI